MLCGIHTLGGTFQGVEPQEEKHCNRNWVFLYRNPKVQNMELYFMFVNIYYALQWDKDFYVFIYLHFLNIQRYQAAKRTQARFCCDFELYRYCKSAYFRTSNDVYNWNYRTLIFFWPESIDIHNHFHHYNQMKDVHCGKKNLSV